MEKKVHKRHNIKIFDVINILILSLVALICMYPFYYLIIYSLSNSTEVARKGIWLLPAKLTVQNYKVLLWKKEILQATFISASRTILGTGITVICSSFFAFLLTKKELVLRKLIYRMLVITMYLNAGIIPYFIIMKNYGFKNNYLLYIVPSAIVAFYVILIKTYMEGIPAELEEAAKIDGAGHLTVFIKVILPVCIPVLATIAVFSAVNQWNSWQDNFYLIRNNDLKTLQLLLLEYLQSMDSTIISDINTAAQKANRTSALSLKACISVITMLPIMLVYPFLQKFFVKGILIGSVKG